MNIEIAKMERMAQTGSSLLRLIQNSHTPVLDLLIRESVQNSLDAANGSESSVKYDISVRTFQKSYATRHFEGIDTKLNEKFADDEQQSIIIRDSNTTGLTGPLHQDEIVDNKYGNLLKLVYEISMPQEKKQAGGSWGLGKTVYFRVGMGLVLYYSRIKLDDGSYQSRLAACLVEDESKPDALIPAREGLKRGIAWWGQVHKEDSTKPITDEKQINQILKDFNVEPYENTETGNTVIIPFIDKEKLITSRENEVDLWWHQDEALYLNIALQRWYAPRIDNELYPYGEYLEPSVNGIPLTKHNMEPVYSIIQSLYVAAAADKEPTSNNNIVKSDDIKVEKIQLRGVLKNTLAGKTAFVKVNKDILKMGVPDNKKSPYEYIDLPNIDNETNPPIVMYLRKPGMIVNYESEGKWTNGIENTPPEDYIIGIFVPNSDNIVTVSEEEISLDEYLRQGEKADHSSWSDIMLNEKKQTIVDRIQKKVTAAIKEEYNQKEKETNTTRSGALSKSLAKMFLPPLGFGNSPGVKRKTPGQGGGGRKKDGKLIITGMNLEEDNSLSIHFEISPPKNAAAIEIEAQVESEGNKKIKGDEWEKPGEIGTRFPIELKHISVIPKTGSETNERIQIHVFSTERYHIENKVQIHLNGYEDDLKGTIKMENHDPMVQSSIQEKILKEGELA